MLNFVATCKGMSTTPGTSGNHKMYAASSTSSTVSSESSTTSKRCVVIANRDIRRRRHSVGSVQRSTNPVTNSQRQQTKKSTSHGVTTDSYQKDHQNPTLQALVKAKCWGIAPLWKFVSYEVENQLNQVRVVFSKHFFPRLVSLVVQNKQSFYIFIIFQ